MRNKQMAGFFFVGCALAAGSSTGLLAQQGNANEADDDRIVVTARGRAETLLEVPLSEKIFDAEAIRDARINQVDDFIALTPGVTIANVQDSGTNFITIRGMSQTRNGEPPVAVVVDNVLQVNARAFDQGLFDMSDIEVLRGPQGALYGRNATNGAIIINTAKPTEELEGYVRATVGEGKEYGIEGALSGPLLDERVLGRLAVRYVEADGYLDNVILGEKVDFAKSYALRGKLHFRISDKFTADVRAAFAKTDSGSLNFNYQPAVIDTATGLPRAFDFTIADADSVQRDFYANNLGSDERDIFQLSLVASYDLGWATLRSVTSYDTLEQSSIGDQFPYTAATTLRPAPPFPFSDGTQTQYVDLEAISQEIRLTSPDDVRLRWMLGGYYLTLDRFISSSIGDDFGRGIARVERHPFLGDARNPTTSFFADDNDNTAWALFFNVAYDINDRLEIAAAGRYDKDEREQNVDARQGLYNASGVLIGAAGAAGARNEASFSRFQPKISARYLIDDATSAYISWGQGFRSGQFNQNGVGEVARAAGLAGVSDLLAQEDSDTFEAGAKREFLDGRIRAAGAIYHTKVENAPYFVFIGAVGAQVLVGIDEVKIIGGELEVEADLYEGLKGFAGLGVSDSEIERYALNPEAVGNEAPYVPKTTFNIGLQYRTRITDRLDFFGRIDYENRGKQYWDPENSTQRSALDLVKLRLGITDVERTWELTASVDNLFDEEYNSEWVTGGFAHPGLPRIIRVDLRWNF